MTLINRPTLIRAVPNIRFVVASGPNGGPNDFQKKKITGRLIIGWSH